VSWNGILFVLHRGTATEEERELTDGTHDFEIYERAMAEDLTYTRYKCLILYLFKRQPTAVRLYIEP
jgi:hypothetical protein